MISIGIDPGVEGYICEIERKAIDVAESVKFWPVPVRDGDRAGEGDDLDDDVFLSILRGVERHVDIIVIEEQQGYPGYGPRCGSCGKPKVMQGVASTFKTGRNYGAMRMAVRALGLPLVVVKPGEWKPVWGLSADKTLSVTKAQVLAPKIDFRPLERKPKARVPDHNKAEAYILAKHGIRLLKGAAV